MSKLTNQTYLRQEQYRDAANLKARIHLHRQYSINKYGFPRWVFDQLEIPEKSRILELGCGSGHFWVANKDRILSEWRIILSDLSVGMVREAKENIRENRQCFRFGIVDAEEIPFEAESFDAVMANHMLYHVPKRDKALSEIRRVLRPGGKLYAATNGKRHLRELREWENTFFSQDIDEGWGNLEGNFTLEAGGEKLSRWFADVQLKRHEDALRVTEVGPIVAYITSLAERGADEGTVERFEELLVQKLAASGAIQITKDSGLFVATRG